MSIYHRLRRRLGHDTTTAVERSYVRRRYTVTHTNGETSMVVANGYKVDGAFAKFYVYDDVYVWHLHRERLTGIPSTTRVLEGIQEIESEPYGETHLRAVVDRADGNVVEKRVRHDA